MSDMNELNGKPASEGGAAPADRALKRRRSRALAGLVVCCIIWGFCYISTQKCYQWFTPMSLVKYRMLVSALTLGLTALIMRKSFRVALRDTWLIALGGLTGVFLYYLLNNLSLDRISASASSIIGGLTPVLTLLAETAVTRLSVKKSASELGSTRIGKKATVAAIISTVGIALVVGLSGEALSGSYFSGVVLMFLAVLAWVVYGMISAVSVTHYDSLVVTFYQALTAAALSFIFLPAESVPWREITWDGYVHLFLMGGLGSGLCYAVYNISTTYVSVTSANILMNVTPLAAIFADMIVFGQRLSFAGWAGTALIILAAVLAVTPLPLGKIDIDITALRVLNRCVKNRRKL